MVDLIRPWETVQAENFLHQVQSGPEAAGVASAPAAGTGREQPTGTGGAAADTTASLPMAKCDVKIRNVGEFELIAIP